MSGSVTNSNHGIVHDLHNLFAISIANLYVAGTAVAAYAVLEGTEAVGLWLGRRWAEYLTFLATVIFVPYEVYELTKTVSALKVIALVINLAIVAYLLIAKRLFGLRGGGKAERAEHDEDTGWAPIERATPETLQACLRRLAHQAGAPALMTPEVIATLADHAQGNLRSLMIMADELLAAAAERQAEKIDEALLFEACALAPQPKAAAGRRR